MLGHAIVLAFVLARSAEAAALMQSPTSVLEGTVVDSSGQVVPGAALDLRDAATNQRRRTVSDDRGAFRFVALAPGTYDVFVQLEGFAPFQQRDLTLAIGTTFRLSIRLAPAAISQTITVTAQPPSLNVSQTSVATLIDSERIEELPVRSRNYLEFALLAPGVSRAQPSSQATPGAALPDSGFTFGGLRPRSNTLTIDGLDNNDAFNGGSRTELSLEIVREFVVLANGWSAERGGASGGAVNVVTKSGANILHGDAFLFAQNGALNATPFLEETGSTKPSLTRYRGGLAAGGPLVKDRTFYYAAGEREETHDHRASDIDPNAVIRINQSPASAILGAGSVTSSLFPVDLAETELSAKLTHQAKPRHALTVRFAGTTTDDAGDAFAAGLADGASRGRRHTRDIAGTGTWTSTISNGIVNEARAQMASRRIDQATPASTPGVVIEGVAEFGQPYAPLGENRQRYLEGADTLTIAAGRHLLKAGFEVMPTTVHSTMVQGANGWYVFRDLAAFEARQPDSFRQASGVQPRSLATTRTGVFVTDHVTASGSLTVDAGIRLDVVTWPSAMSISQRQVEPRFGFAWSPRAAWVVRGGAGIFADRIPLAALDRVLAMNGVSGFEEILEPPAGSALRSIYTARSGGWHPSSRQASIGVERLLTSDLTVSANYLFVHGVDLPRTVNVGLPNAMFELQPTAESSFHGLSVAANRRLSHEIAWSASYTWSRASDTASDFDEQPQNPVALHEEWGRFRYDQPHRLVANALFDLPIGDEEDRTPGTTPAWWVRALSNIEVATIITVSSGQPVNPITGADDSHVLSFPLVVRPQGAPRNSLRLPAFAAADVRLLKAIAIKPHGKLDLVVEAFNILNRQNIIGIDPVFGSGPSPRHGFGRATEAANARHIQFSIDFEF